MTGFYSLPLHDDFREAGGNMASSTIGAKITVVNIILAMTIYTVSGGSRRLHALSVTSRTDQALMLTRQCEARFGIMVKPPALPPRNSVAFAARRRGTQAAEMMVINMARLACDTFRCIAFVRMAFFACHHTVFPDKRKAR